jgi:hypothetical protein
MLFRNVGWHPTDYTVLYPRTQKTRQARYFIGLIFGSGTLYPEFFRDTLHILNTNSGTSPR